MVTFCQIIDQEKPLDLHPLYINHACAVSALVSKLLPTLYAKVDK